MDMQFSESDILLRNSVQKLLEKRVPLKAKIELDAEASTFDYELWKEFAELGWLSAACAEELDTVIALGIVAEEVGRKACATPFLRAAAASLILARHGEGDRKKDLLEKASDGSQILIPLGIEDEQEAVHIEPIRETYRISFRQRLVEWAHHATGYVILAWQSDGLPVLVHLDKNAPGLIVEQRQTFDNASLATVSLQDAEVTGNDIVGLPGDVKALQETLAITRLMGAAEAVGGAEGALNLVVGHVREREQFGRKIGAFQSVQHGLADAKILVEGASLAVWSGLSDASLGRSSIGSAALASWLAQRAFQETVVKAALYHGGMGHTRESELQFLYRRAGTSHARLGSQWDLLGSIADYYVDPNFDRVTD